MTAAGTGHEPAEQYHAYRRTRKNITGLVTRTPDTAAAGVPACPDWTVRDLIGHLVHICESFVALEDNQIDLRPSEGVDLTGLLDRWDALDSELREALDRTPNCGGASCCSTCSRTRWTCASVWARRSRRPAIRRSPARWTWPPWASASRCTEGICRRCGSTPRSGTGWWERGSRRHGPRPGLRRVPVADRPPHPAPDRGPALVRGPVGDLDAGLRLGAVRAARERGGAGPRVLTHRAPRAPRQDVRGRTGRAGAQGGAGARMGRTAGERPARRTTGRAFSFAPTVSGAGDGGQREGSTAGLRQTREVQLRQRQQDRQVQGVSGRPVRLTRVSWSRRTFSTWLEATSSGRR